MKGSNSRFSHRPVKLFSNIAHVQGGMVTDADLTEAGQIHQARDETQTTLTLNSGSPQRQGIVRLSGGLPSLREGYVVAEGKIGQLFQPEGLSPKSVLSFMPISGNAQSFRFKTATCQMPGSMARKPPIAPTR